MNAVADAYGAGAAAWAAGPARVYGPLAEALVAFCPSPLDGRLVLDLGSGTGVGSRAARAVGARVVATDIAREMLLLDRHDRPSSAVGDAASLPFRSGAFDVVLACFSLNHFDDPAPVVREAGRVASLVLVSTYANDDDHPVKRAADEAMREVDWQPPDWYTTSKYAMTTWGTVDTAARAIERGGLVPQHVEHIDIHFDHLGADDLVAWRLGMAHTAPHLAALDDTRRAHVHARAVELLGPDPEPLVRRVIFVAAGRA